DSAVLDSSGVGAPPPPTAAATDQAAPDAGRRVGAASPGGAGRGGCRAPEVGQETRDLGGPHDDGRDHGRPDPRADGPGDQKGRRGRHGEDDGADEHVRGSFGQRFPPHAGRRLAQFPARASGCCEGRYFSGSTQAGLYSIATYFSLFLTLRASPPAHSTWRIPLIRKC
ncbi:unnamed protein product, partial [Prorocentrum cordatum]